MPELEALKQFRADVPAPSQAAVARARARMVEPRRRVVARPRPKFAQHRNWMVAAVGAVAVTAAVIVLPTVSLGEHHPPIATTSALEVLDQAAAVGGGQSVATDRYWFSETRSSASASAKGVEQTWTAADGTVTAWDDGRPQGTAALPGRGMTAASVAELPDDPVELHTRLLRNTAPGAPADVQVLKSAASLLGGSPTTPAVRAALFRMCSTLPGVISDGPARDELNRPGVQVHLERTIPHSQGARIRVVMIVAPDTARILQLEMFMVGEKSTPMIYVRSGYVHSIGDVPAS